ncbi:MAG: N-6 DNA methylase [Streptosporangiaceae bacterium]
MELGDQDYLTREAWARAEIDRQLDVAGWVVQSQNELNLSAGGGVAVREATLEKPHGRVDYLLFVDGRPVGAVEVKLKGTTLTEVEHQSGKYLEGLPMWTEKPVYPLSFIYQSTGAETRFTNAYDPEPRSRRVFTFHRPGTLAEWSRQITENPEVPTFRARLKAMPPLDERGLRSKQAEAIRNTEKSLAEDRPRTLIQMATGSGKMFTAANLSCRLIRHAGARRILFLVDRSSLGTQAKLTFDNLTIPQTQRKFPAEYNVQRLTSNTVDRASRVCISTIQRVFTILKGDAEPDENPALATEPVGVIYSPALPPDAFDVIIIDECHRSIYGQWRQVLEYFDAHLIGLTATPNKQALEFFGQNLVMEYSFDRALADGVNVHFQKLWNYCNVLRDDGLSNQDYIEQLTFLLFLKMADEQTRPPFSRPAVVPRGLDWASLVRLDGDSLEAQYRHILAELGRFPGTLGVIFRKAQNKIQDPAKLKRLVSDLIDREQWMIPDAKVKGDVYEGLLAKNAEDVKSGAGQYFTPRPLIRAIVDVMRPTASMRVCDPAAGTGGFLLAAYEQMRSARLDPDEKRFLQDEALRGWEIVDATARLCAMNLLLHGISAPESPSLVTIDDSLRSTPAEHFDMVLTNPPFGRKSSYKVVNALRETEREEMSYLREDFWATTSNKQLNFLQHVRSLLTINGRAAIVVPDNVLFEGGAGETVRRRLLEQCDVHTLLRLPTGIFYAGGVKANVLFFDRKPPSEKPWTQKLWIYDFRTDQSFTLKTRVLTRADLDDFVACYNPGNRHERTETERFRAFSYDELVARDKASLDISWLRDADLLPDSGMTSIRAFEYAASADLNRYVREFAVENPELDAALSAGRLPFPPELVRRSPQLARLAARIWAVTSIDSPAYHQLFEANGQFHDAPLPATTLLPRPEGTNKPSRPQEDPFARRPHRSHAQAEGARLEHDMLKIFERLFRIEDGNWQAETSDARMPQAQVRRQRSGTQYGADIVIRFKGTAIDASSTCLVECKNYAATASGLTVSTVADKVLQADANFDAEPVDHWILVSPALDPNNELDRLVERWNATQRFPFTVQIWSPQTGIRELFTVDPDIYYSLYGEDPPESRRGATDILAEFSERLRPPVRMPERLRRYVQDPRSFVEPSERGWLDQLDAQIERFGFDEKGVRLGRPLEAEVLSVLVDSPKGSNVALLLADFGEGKSFFTLSLCVRLQDRYLGEPRSGSPIPLRFHLRGYRHVSAPTDFLRTQLELLGLSMADWAELRRGNVLVVLDGLDEMSVRQDRATTRANLDKVGSLLELLEGLPVLVTSRPHFFASNADRERFYDRLRRPHVFRMGQPDRRDTVVHLRAYADSLDLAPKLNKIEDLYDPIGLAGKVLFLEMIKKTLPELPEDHFDELVLYETYVRGSLNRKIELLRDPGSAMHDADLLDGLEKLLEKIAVAIHVSGEGSVDLQEFAAHWGGAAQLLWHAAQLDSVEGSIDDDASARIGSRSLLRRVSPETEDRWLVDFFHRSMKEYFVAKAFRRALNSPDAFATTRELLLKAPVQPEILGFFRLLANADQHAATVLASLAHSARVGSDQGILGGGAISLYHAAGGQFAGSDWRSLQLDGAILAGADLSGSDFQGSTLRAADLSSANLSGTDLTSADLTGANLDAGGSVIGLTPDASAHRFLCLTEDCELGRISAQADGSLKLSVIQLPRTLRWPESVYLLREDLVLVTGHSEFLIADISEGTATEVAYFRVSSDLRGAAVVDQGLLGLLFESEYADSEALLIDIESGQVRWRVPVQPGAGACGWFTHGVVMTSGEQLFLFRQDRNTMPMRHGDLEPSGAAICVHDDQAILVTEYGHETWLPLDSIADPEHTLVVHHGAGTAVTAANGDVLSSGTDGSVALTRRDANGVPAVVARVERRLRCAGAHIKNMKSEREFAVFTANGAAKRS